MPDIENQTVGGQLAFRLSGSSAWQALTEDAFVTFNLDGRKEDSRELSEEELRAIDKNQQQLSEVLAGALKLPNLALFAGCGTSLGEAGGPSMWDLWRLSMLKDADAEDSDKATLSNEATAACAKVKYTPTDKPNIEHFISHCEAYLLFNEDKSLGTFLRNVKEVILSACTSFIEDATSDISAHHGLLQKLARRRARDARLKVFTTNYDACFEKAASDLGMMLVDGLSYTRKRRFDGQYFDYDVVKREGENHEFVEGVFQLYKLHGSVSWERSGGDVFESPKPSADMAVIIYPAKGKYQQAFIQPHLELFSRFIEALRTPNNCFLIAGFGFNDDHLAEPILSAIRSNPSLKLIIADPSASSKVESDKSSDSNSYWRELADLSSSGYDIGFINATFSELVTLVPNLRALSPAEQLAKAIKRAGK